MGKHQGIQPGRPQTLVQCVDLKRNMHQAFSRDLELGRQMYTQTPGDKSPVPCRLFIKWARRNTISLKEELVRRMLGSEGGTNRGRFLFQGHLYPNIEPGDRRGPGWDLGGQRATDGPRISQQRLRKSCCHTWGSPSFIGASVRGLLTTSSNWLIFPHLSGSQLHWLSWASAEREAEYQKKKLLSHYSYSFPYSLPHPLSLHCHASFFFFFFFFKNSFYNKLFLYVASALGILPMTCLQRDTPPL